MALVIFCWRGNLEQAKPLCLHKLRIALFKDVYKGNFVLFIRYDDNDVPDTMNVHGIYDTKASMVTFESRSEFQSFLQMEAGVSGSYFGFYAGVKSAFGESKSGASQKYMALLSVDINR